MEDEMLRGRGTSLLGVITCNFTDIFLSLVCLAFLFTPHHDDEAKEMLRNCLFDDSLTRLISSLISKNFAGVRVCDVQKRIKCAFKLENRK
jgi:hypothetical protein